MKFGGLGLRCATESQSAAYGEFEQTPWQSPRHSAARRPPETELQEAGASLPNKRIAEHEKALLLGQQGLVTNSHGRLPCRRTEHFSKADRLLACEIPRKRLCKVHINVGVALEIRAQGNKHGTRVWWVA